MCVQRKVESHLPHDDEDDDGFEKVEDGASSPRCLMSYGAFFCLSVFFSHLTPSREQVRN